jgi:hypothetical protein
MTKLEEFTEAVAAATREVSVAEALVREHQGKLRLAEEEAENSRRRLDAARRELEKAVLEKHEAIHGKPVSFDDRMEFEQRWDARLAENKAIQAERDQRRLEEIKAWDAKIISANDVRENLGLNSKM